MRRRAPLLLSLGSALAFLASLYLPWTRWSGTVTIFGPCLALAVLGLLRVDRLRLD